MGVFCFVGAAIASDELPTLYAIANYTFSGPYSCGDDNYNTSALFVSSYSEQRNEPDLLYNGVCNGDGSIQITTAGSELGYVTDLGIIPLTEVSPFLTQNNKNLYTPDEVNLTKGHTYAAVGAKQSFRYIIAFTVESLTEGGPLTISYSVLMYEVHSVTEESQGFSWDATPGMD